MSLTTENPIPATLGLSSAAAREWDVAVVGAGPAGALAARQAAIAGASVVLVDKASFPRWKVCGCCVNQAALSVLESVGLGDLPAGEGARPLTRIRLASGGRFADVALPGGVSLSRERLDAALVRAAIAAGAHFLPQTEATLAPQRAEVDCRNLQLRRRNQTTTVRARVVLAADGLAGRLIQCEPQVATRVVRTSRLGAGTVLDDGPAFYREGVVFMACGRGGYVGLVRLEDGRLEAAAALDRDAVRRHAGPGALASEVLEAAGFPVPDGLESAAWRGTPPLTRRPARLYAERLLVLGDAAGYIEPFTGEGMAWALAGGAAVAPLAVAAGGAWSDEAGRMWQTQHRRIVARRQRVCCWVSRLLRRPRLCSAAVAALNVAPQLASPLVQTVNRPIVIGH